MHWFVILFSLMACATVVFYLLALIGAWDWSRQEQSQTFSPGVSILKPLKGADPGMLESFRSHCQQKYAGEYEIIFGVNDANDEAVSLVEQLTSEFPERSIRLVICDEVLGTNRKVSNLVRMIKEARFGFVLVNDGDIRVPDDYLTKVMNCFAPEVAGTSNPVGMVTCLYRADADGSIWSRLESLGISVEFISGTLVSRWIERGVNFGLGATLCMKREALAAAGGFDLLVDHLADDYELAARIIRAGYRVVLPSVVVVTHIQDYDFTGFWKHQLRWMRTIRSCRPAGYPGLLVMYGQFFALLAYLFSGGAIVNLLFLVIVWVMQMVMYGVFHVQILGSKFRVSDLVLLPVRGLIAPILWFTGTFGDSIEWRGEVFRLDKGILHKT